MMENLWNSQFWYLYWLLPTIAIVALVASQIISKIQSKEFYRRGLKHIDPEAFKKAPETRMRMQRRLARWVRLFEAQVAETRSYRDDAIAALRAAEAAKGWKAAQGAAIAARTSAQKAEDSAHAAAMYRKGLPTQAVPESEQQFPLPRPDGAGAGGRGGGGKAAGGAKARRALDPKKIITSATGYAAAAKEAAEAAEAIAARWKQSQAAD